MYPVSDAYRNAITQNERNVRIVGTITLKDGTVINIDDEDILQGSLYLSEQCVSGEDIEVGNVYASELGFTLTAPPANPYILDGARVVINFGIETSEGVWEYVPLGYFYVTDIERKNTAVNLKALDGLILFDVDLSGVLTTGTPYSLIQSCCTKAGVVLATSSSAFENFANGLTAFTIPEDSKIETCRDLIMWVCQLTGTFARMNRLGQLEIMPVKAGAVVKTLNKQQRYSVDVSDFIVNITKVEMKVGETEYSQGSDGLVMVLEENPFLAGMEDNDINEILTNLLNQISTVEYTPCNVNFIGDPALQAGDWVKLTGVGLLQREKDTVFLTGDFPAETDYPVAYAFVTHSTWRYRGPHQIRAVGKTGLLKGVQSQQSKKIDNAYSSISSVKAVAETAREIAQAANQSTQLIQDAITGYVLIRKNETTGSNEILIMDNPDPAQARKVWRWNMGGLGYSDNVVGVDNPSRVYNVAMTMDGAINADFVKTGKLIADVVQIGPTTTFEEGYDPSTKETPAGAQAKANAAETNAKAYATQQASAAQSAAEDYADTILQQLANGQYTGGTFINGKSVISPVIAGLEGRFAGEVKVGVGNDLAGISGEGTDANSVRFWAGHADKTQAPFKVMQNGALVATGVTISGIISAIGDIHVGKDLYLFRDYVNQIGGAIYFGIGDPPASVPYIYAEHRESGGQMYNDLWIVASYGNLLLMTNKIKAESSTLNIGNLGVNKEWEQGALDVAGDIHCSGRYYGKFGAEYVPPNADLNDYKTPGFYYNSSTAQSATIVNIPEGLAFALVILQAATIIQIWIPYTPTRFYMRAWQSWNNVWTSWRRYNPS